MSLPNQVMAFLISILLLFPAITLRADESQDIEAHVRHLASGLRCLVCQNQSLADSHADLAIDLKKQIRLMVLQGASDKEIIDFMVQRYGDFVLYRPPFKTTTFMLWLGPLFIGLLALFMMVRFFKTRHRSASTTHLSDDEARRVAELLQEEDKA